MASRVFSLTVHSAGYIEQERGKHAGFGWSADEFTDQFDHCTLPSRWHSYWVLAMDCGGKVEVFVDGKVLGSLIGGNVTHLDWDWTFGGRRFYSISKNLGSIVGHITYERRSQREQEVAERSASLLMWLLSLGDRLGRTRIGDCELAPCKFVKEDYTEVTFPDRSYQGFTTRVDAIKAVADEVGKLPSNERDVKVVLA